MESHIVPDRVNALFLLVAAHRALSVSASRRRAVRLAFGHPIAVRMYSRGAFDQLFERTLVLIFRLFRGEIKSALVALPIFLHAPVHAGGGLSLVMGERMPFGRQRLAAFARAARLASARLRPARGAVDIRDLPFVPIMLARGGQNGLLERYFGRSDLVGKILAAGGAVPIGDIARRAAGLSLGGSGDEGMSRRRDGFLLAFVANLAGAVSRAFGGAACRARIAPFAPIVIARGGRDGLLERYLGRGSLVGKELFTARTLPIFDRAVVFAGRRKRRVTRQRMSMLLLARRGDPQKQRKRQNGAQNKDENFALCKNAFIPHNSSPTISF